MNIKSDLISIIIPVFNTEKFLKQCINTVLRQTYDNIEIILIDDASTDNSAKICEEYAKNHEKITYIKNKKNNRVSKTRNIGIEKSRGKYICFIDSDDYISENYIENLYENSEQNTLVICQILKFCKGVIKNEKIEKDAIQIYNNNEFLKLYKDGLINSPCARLYEKDIIICNNIKFDESLSLGEDLLFNFAYLSKISQIKLLSNTYYYYRQEDKNSLSNKYFKDMFNIQKKLYEEFTKFFKENDEEEKSDELINFCTTIVSNEFHNKDKKFIKRYFEARKKLKSNFIKEIINSQQKYMNKLEYFCLSNGLYLCYKLIAK